MESTTLPAARALTVRRLDGGPLDRDCASNNARDVRLIHADQRDKTQTQTSVNQRQRLPQELFDAIIDQLTDDTRTLATCSLVCRSWVPVSRHHLFRDIIITPDTISHVSQLLASSTCTIIPAVQRLCLIRIQNLVGLQELMCRLPRVTQLRLCLSDLSCDGPIFPPFALIPLLRNLESLQLESFVADTHEPLLSLLRQSPRLRSLSCITALFKSLASPNVANDSQLVPADQINITPDLRTLKVFMSDLLLELLMASWTNAVPQITNLHMWFLPYTTLGDSTASLLRDLGWSLEVFKLHGLPDNLSELPPSFVYLTKLRLFSFDSSVWQSNPNSAARFVLRALRQLTSPILEGLTISMHSVPCSELDADTWADLGSLLETPRLLSMLRTLSFQFHESHFRIGPEAARVREQWISERFGLYAARGLLRVESLLSPSQRHP